MIWIGFSMMLTFLLLSQIHLLYTPTTQDTTHHHYHALLSPQPRLIGASLTSFLIVQFFDIKLFSLLRKKIGTKFFPLRATTSLLLTETLDTLLFSFLGLAGMVASLRDIILFSLLAKLVVVVCSLPLLTLAKRSYRHVQI